MGLGAARHRRPNPRIESPAAAQSFHLQLLRHDRSTMGKLERRQTGRVRYMRCERGYMAPVEGPSITTVHAEAFLA